MTLAISWLPGALDDLANGARWYNEQHLGLGAEFVAEVRAAAEATSSRPFVLRRLETSGLPEDAEFRQVFLKRFSEYGVVYAVDADQFVVVAVAHSKRKPGYWIERLEKPS